LGKEARISRSYHYNILFQVVGFQTQRPVEDQVAVLQVKTSPGGDGFCQLSLEKLTLGVAAEIQMIQ
jgi:hypothetical protein